MDVYFPVCYQNHQNYFNSTSGNINMFAYEEQCYYHISLASMNSPTAFDASTYLKKREIVFLHHSPLAIILLYTQCNKSMLAASEFL